jgi:hypothetical protein
VTRCDVASRALNRSVKAQLLVLILVPHASLVHAVQPVLSSIPNQSQGETHSGLMSEHSTRPSLYNPSNAEQTSLHCCRNTTGDMRSTCR